MSNIIDIEFGALRAGDNARKTFNPVKLQELKNSIREHGIQQNLVGYRDPEKPGEIIIIAGERRWRATTELIQELLEAGENDLAAKRAQVPVKVIAPEEVPYAKEINLIENLQREDITPAEEAEGYADMLQRLNPATDEPYTIKELATKLGMENDSYIRRRLKLRNAPAVMLAAVADKKIGAAIAELVGGIPDPKAREQAAKEILEPEDQEVPMTFAQAKEWINERYRISLGKGCEFDTDDPQLVPVKYADGEGGERVCGGACTDCPFRSGNMADIKDDLQTAATGTDAKGKKGGGKGGIDPNLCTNPACFRLKTDAHWKQLKARKMEEVKKLAEKETDPKEKAKVIEAMSDRVIIEGDKAKKIFGGWQGEISYDANYRRASEKPSAGDLNYDYEAEKKAPTWKAMAEQVGLPIVLARNPHTGKVEQLVEKSFVIEKVKAVAKDAGKKSIFDRQASSGSGQAHTDRANKAARERAKLETIMANLGATALLDSLTKQGLDADAWEIVFEIALGHAGEDGLWFMGKWLGLEKATTKSYQSNYDYEKPIIEYVRKLAVDNATVWQKWTVIVLVLKHAKYSGTDGEDFKAMAKHFGIDRAKLETEAKAQMKEKKKPKPKAISANVPGSGKSQLIKSVAAVAAAAVKRAAKNGGKSKPKTAAKKAKAKK